MDATEKKVIRSVNKILLDAAKSSFKEGDVHVWADYAKCMRISIENSIKILNDLLEDDEKEQKDSNLKL